MQIVFSFFFKKICFCYEPMKIILQSLLSKDILETQMFSSTMLKSY